MNLADLIRRHAQGRPRRVAVVAGERHWTYAEFWHVVAQSALRLSEAGVAPGERVALALGDHPGHVAALFAVAALGGVAVPVDHRATPSERRSAVRAFGTRLFLHDAGTDAGVDGATLSVAPLPATPQSAPAIALADRADEDWLISLSSGSTGRPTGALVTHAQMHARFVTQWVSLGFSSTERFALVTPLHFGAGRSFALATLAAGATLILVPPPQPPEALVAALNASAATATFLVPTMMRRLLEVEGDPPLLGGLHRLLISGERFHANEIARFQSHLCAHLLGYYASSEGGGISVLQPEDFAAFGATVGQCAYGVELQIVDAQDRPVATGETGRVRYRGPGVALRTLGEDGAVHAAPPGGWCYPGDVASVDADGYVTLRGREKDMIVRAGVNVHPAEIEAVLSAHAQVHEAAVVGVPSASHGEQALAFVVADTDTEELMRWCAARMAPYKRPAAIRLLSALPRTAAGKIDKRALRERAAAPTGDADERQQ